MYVGFIILVQSARCVDFNVSADLGFDLKIEDLFANRTPSWRGQDSEDSESVSVELSLDSKKTRSEASQCPYELPEDKQVNTLLSNMMNVLTKIFTRTRELNKARLQWRGRGRGRSQRTRFRVVGAKESPYFDDIYATMTQEFRSFYQRASGNATVRLRRSDGDQCEQPRRLWRGLLRRSQDELRHAAGGLIDQQLEAQNNRDARLRRKLQKLLRREMRIWRSRQLDWICQRRVRCYTELS